MIRPLWIDVDLRLLRNNLKLLQKQLGKKARIIATVKQSAYGHGLIPVARELGTCGIDCFGVASLEEAITLREDGFPGDIIILSSILEKHVDYFVQHNIIPTVVDIGFAKRLNKAASQKSKVMPIHVKVDTGMGRLGFYHKQAHSFIKKLSKFSNIYLEGIYTHFPAADSDYDFTNYQIEIFNNFISQLKKENITFKYQHCANSIGIINYPQAHFNMVRPGLILYGIKPTEDINMSVEPILSLKSKLIFVKKIEKGMSVGYARSYISKKSHYIGTVAVGYADGYPWHLSNKAQVIIDNKLFDIAGRVCMDHIMVDLGDSEGLRIGKEVILIGKSKQERITAEDLAKKCQTIPYEIVSRLSPNIPRVYKNSILKGF